MLYPFKAVSHLQNHRTRNINKKYLKFTLYRLITNFRSWIIHVRFNFFTI